MFLPLLFFAGEKMNEGAKWNLLYFTHTHRHTKLHTDKQASAHTDSGFNINGWKITQSSQLPAASTRQAASEWVIKLNCSEEHRHTGWSVSEEEEKLTREINYNTNGNAKFAAAVDSLSTESMSLSTSLAHGSLNPVKSQTKTKQEGWKRRNECQRAMVDPPLGSYLPPSIQVLKKSESKKISTFSPLPPPPNKSRILFLCHFLLKSGGKARQLIQHYY